jgi:hypothetical protein
MDTGSLKASFSEMSDIFLKIKSQLWNLFYVTITEIITSLVGINEVVSLYITCEDSRGVGRIQGGNWEYVQKVCGADHYSVV